MRTIYHIADGLLEKQIPFVLATVIRTWGSAPRKEGSHMLIWEDQMLGSVSGGCVENDVFTKASEITHDVSGRLLHYGVSDEDAWGVGLSCGGKIDVLLECFSSERDADRNYWNVIREAIEHDTGGIVIHPLSGEQDMRTAILAGKWSDSEMDKLSRSTFEKRAHTIITVNTSEFFIEVIPPRHRLIIIGAAHITVELVNLARQFDFEVSVIDPLGFYSEKTMFTQQPDHIYSAWPVEVLADISLTSYTYAVTLSHDPKIDDQALEILLRSDIAYIGALGSKKTHAKRISRLEAAGFTPEQIGRIHAPVGLDINAQSAQEIALSILADLIREKNKYL